VPQRPPRVCSKVGCLALTTASNGRCSDHPLVPFAHLHAREARRYHNARRPESDRFYKTVEWQRLRASVLARNPLCVECERLGRVTVARVVDHIKPFRDRPDLGLERSNLRPLCAACHNRIGARVGQGKGG
jgi:5-methylcytosine-specific restriction enzyme A